jgi:hypothetical protein
LLTVHNVLLSSFCILCLISDEPGAPGTPEATDWDKDHVDLRWTPPVKDGGSPITGYVIEKREKGSPRWTKAGETKGPDCKGRAENLEEGVTYEFRVRAVNAAGPGEPSEASKPITAKPRKCTYNSVSEPVGSISVTASLFN